MKDIELLRSINFKKGGHLAREINGQPDLWENTYMSVLEKKDQLLQFLNEIFKINNLQIVLSGAGSSAFIGEILQQSFFINTGVFTVVVPTTDLVTHPRGLIHKTVPTLLISFARSGDSPESTATFELAEKMYDRVYHIVITCNAEGNLAKKAYGKKNSYVFILPETANDQALAMTGSFTSMTFAGLLISDIIHLKNNHSKTKKLVEYGNLVLQKYAENLREVSTMDFKRVVFLGSGALKGAAKESHLKLLEMTDGQIICQHDSFLGFRHGPRAAIDSSTLLIYLFSADPYVYKYETDLVKSIHQKGNYLFSIGIGQCLHKLDDININLSIDLCCENECIPDDYFSICAVLPAQIIGFYKSILLGLTPDSPSQKGSINRIVQGVTIYPY